MVAKEQISLRHRVKRIIFFFPFQLFLYQLRTNTLLLFPWLILFGYVTQKLALNFGVPYLFLYPEYLGEVGFMSHLILGVACGGFIMAYNIACYIINGHSFSFIATLSRPFYKYSINNFIIPVGFVVVYAVNLVFFQLYKEFETATQVSLNLIGFFFGNLMFITLSFGYFFTTNKSIFSYLTNDDENTSPENEEKIDEKKQTRATGILHRIANWTSYTSKSEDIKVETYLSSIFKISLARDSEHYDRKVLKSVFSQNHINASLFEMLIVISLVILGIFRDNPLFVIPAGASVLLIFTVLTMILSAMYSWFRRWTFLIVVAIGLTLSFGFDSNTFEYTNYAYGLDYSIKQKYNQASLESLANNKNHQKNDLQNGVEILNNWKERNATKKSILRAKPKLVIINSSGGGLRSSVWSFYALSFLDSLTQGKILKRTHLMTGSSGGLLGSSYIRELYLRRQLDKKINLNNKRYLNNISKDLLNPVTFTMVINDFFPRFQKFSDGKYEYPKDRGYSFEKQFIANTESVMTKRIRDYSNDEYEARVPLFIITPTITNDARRLLIASQPMSYLVNNSPGKNVRNENIVEYIEFSKFFKENNADNLRFMTALRMNATFPYILPNATLPTNPPINVMDAGLRDNYGTEISLKYILSHKDWLEKNTSGIIIIQLRDSYKESMQAKSNNPQKSEEVLSPVGAVYRNITKTHNYMQDNLLQYASEWYGGDIDIINLELERSNKDIISLSWRLTRKEKLQILNSIHSTNNRIEIQRLMVLLDEG